MSSDRKAIFNRKRDIDCFIYDLAKIIIGFSVGLMVGECKAAVLILERCI